MDTSTDAVARLSRVVGALESTPTGIGLLNSVVVLPVGPERTDVEGVPNGAVNFYVDGGSLWMQVFAFDEQAWFRVELT